MNNTAHDEIDTKHSSVYLLNASAHKIPTQTSLIEPSLGFTVSLNEQLDEEFDILELAVNFYFLRVLIVEGNLAQAQETVNKAKLQMVALIQDGEYEHMDEMHLSDSFLVWPIPGKNKYLCIICSRNSEGLESRLEGIDFCDRDSILFDSDDVHIPDDFSLENQQLFLNKRYKKIQVGAGRLKEVWDFFHSLDRQTYEISEQKKNLLENIKTIPDTLAPMGPKKVENKI